MTVWQVVQAAVHKAGLPPDRAWGMTLADLVMVLREPEGRDVATDQFAVRAMCLAHDIRLDLLGRLTVGQRAELEEWKSQLM